MPSNFGRKNKTRDNVGPGIRSPEAEGKASVGALEVDAADVELLHTPICCARYDRDGKRIALVIDANNGGVINSIAL